MTAGPLAGLRVLEFAGLGPAPFCAMLFADLGADVLRVDRPGARYDPSAVVFRGRPSVVLDLKSREGPDVAMRLAERADILIEGYRPGAMERLGLGPEAVMGRNPALVYGRMTGWGQSGPRAQEPGHDINYLALVGALHAMGSEQEPIVPLNLVADFGGGALYLAFGALAALTEARATGRGRVIDCAMVDGVASLMTMLYGHLATGYWIDRRQSNTIDGGAHFYTVYQCACGNWLAVGAIEPRFHEALLKGLGLDPAEVPQRDRALWPELRLRFAEIFRGRSRAEWLEKFAGTEACVTPVLSMTEAMSDPHNLARGTFAVRGGVPQPVAAPRFSDVPVQEPGPVSRAGEGGAEALAAWGLTDDETAGATPE